MVGKTYLERFPLKGILAMTTDEVLKALGRYTRCYFFSRLKARTFWSWFANLDQGDPEAEMAF
jgi:hypothetical protein